MKIEALLVEFHQHYRTMNVVKSNSKFYIYTLFLDHVCMLVVNFHGKSSEICRTEELSNDVEQLSP